MEELPKLLSSLADMNRLRIIAELETHGQRLSQLATMLHASATETSRHITSLSEARLIEKDRRGFYSLTSFGKLALELLPTLSFIAKNKDYLVTHELTSLPPGFPQRLGDLSECEFVESLSDVLRNVIQTLTYAKSYAWIMVDQPAFEINPYNIGGNRNISWRLILPFQTNFKISIDPQARPKVEYGRLERVEVALALNETAGVVSFPELKGEIDLTSGFRGEDPSFQEWCHDLFSYYWERATKAPGSGPYTP